MHEKPINQVVADSLAYWMAKAEISQSALATKAGVSQKTISNYLNPDQRAEGAKGKPPSPKLTELDLIARALGKSVWQLTRPMDDRERVMYERIERAYQELVASAPPAAVTPEKEITPPLTKPASRKRNSSATSDADELFRVKTGGRDARSKSDRVQKQGAGKRH